jgi:hypothetical protein
MRNVGSSCVESFLEAYHDNGTQPRISFDSVIDNRTKLENYTARAVAKNFSKCYVESIHFTEMTLTIKSLLSSARTQMTNEEYPSHEELSLDRCRTVLI